MTHGAATVGIEPSDHSHAHPGARTYIEIAIFLTIITVIEVAIYYVDWMHDNGVLVPALFVLSIAKFLTVIGYYMHLRFDDPRFRYMFLAGLAVAVAIVGSLFVLMTTHRIDFSFDLL